MALSVLGRGGGEEPSLLKAVRHVELSTDDFSRILIPKNSSVTDSPCNFLRGVNDVYHIVFGV